MAPYTPFNPLEINLRRQTQNLASIIPPGTPWISNLQSASNTQEFLSILSDLLANPAYTQIIATLFRPILTDLCARWLDVGSETNLAALCLLIEVHEELFPILSRLLYQFFPKGPLWLLSDTHPPTSIESPRLHRLLLSYFRVLQANRQLPNQHQWSLTPLSQLIWTDGLDSGIRLLAIKCYAIQAEMGEVESEKIEQQLLGEVGQADCLLEYGVNVDGSKKFVDAWILESVEIQRVRKERSELVTEQIDFYKREEGDPPYFIEGSDLSASVENIQGVLLLKSSKTQGTSPNYIPVPTTNAALSNIAHHLSLRLPMLLTSAPSAGKALLLHHLASLLRPESKNHIVTLHLADTSLDARGLLGSYISSTTQPGTFEWKEGVLVRAMREGKWIVLEDVDRGSSEVLGTLKPLVESLRAGKWIGGRACIHVPGRGEIVAHEDFLIFATRSVSRSPSSKFPAPTFLSAHKFHEVIIDSPPLEELDTIISGRFPRLAGIATKSIIHMWDSLNSLRPSTSTREFGLRDLIKFCTRIERILPSSYSAMDIDADQPTLSSVFSNPVLREDVYLQARDVFFGSGTMTAASSAGMQLVAKVVGEQLGLDTDRCQWLIDRRTPEFQVEADTNGSITGLRIARTYLPSRKQTNAFSSSLRPFAIHRPAVCLLARIATAISLEEPLLLIGETGTGKTSVITYLASTLRRPLVSLNLSQQTESSDLIGGLKPVDARIPGSHLQERFSDLFGSTFSRKKNEKFETSIRKAVNEGKWRRVVGLWKESVRMAQERFKAKNDVASQGVDADRVTEATLPRKRRKIDEGGLEGRERAWAAFLRDVEDFEIQHVHGKGKFTFAFVEGPLIKALRSGDWILLDEINLASPETLECITSLLHGPTASITLTENGELEPVPRHPDFRLFACMNPATDVGKKDLPPNIRTKFTEIDVPPPDADKETLLSIIEKYIGGHTIGDKGAIMNVAEFYLAVKDLAEKHLLADGANHRPHFSMRTLARALTFAADNASTYSLRRAIWEGCLMAFTMVLDSSSSELVMTLAHKHLLAGVRNSRSMLSKEPNPPQNADDYVKVGPFYLAKGPMPYDAMEHYIMTPSVETKLKDLARIILTRRFPVLIEGPTSSGKTSSIEYLAKRTGHEFIRINNHEHTDIQEYIGSYVSDPVTGKLVFQDGLLVQALRKGSWIVLDELNLAPTDVLEALNRLLDDNRELVIPETQEIVQPHPSFMLFATQNPPGLYAGRKILSRAFRNRFLEVQFEDVPQAELEVILCQRSRIAPSYGKKIVEVFRQLQKRRQSSRVFESKQGFVTLRDLFRWAGRDAIGYQELAENGYMLLAERTRREEDKVAVKEVLESVMNVRIDEDGLYDLRRHEADIASFLGCSLPPKTNIIWTKAMQRLFVLVSRALKFKEPLLMVGETGSGKTSVCQVFADAVNRKLHGLSCHQNTETADIIGGLRPLRNRQALVAESVQEATSFLQRMELVGTDDHDAQTIQRVLEKTLKSLELDEASRSTLESIRSKLMRSQAIFEWCDGPLIEAMRNGEIFLLDEISLAEDSVLERLNSVLEPERTIVLAERGGSIFESPHIQAHEDFRLVATMNPGGDYGKKELSPALRNRFTEIWVPQVDDRHDLELIADSLWKTTELKVFTSPLLDFIGWLCVRLSDRSIQTLRDILAWITFTNHMHDSPQCPLRLNDIFHHAAHMTYLDGLGSLPQLSGYSKQSISAIKVEAIQKLESLVPLSSRVEHDQPSQSREYVKLGSFSLKVGDQEPKPQLFTLSAPTTQNNALRLTRACQVPKPILLEGSPGVGKTSLVVALANITGQKLHRINLSDQTDLVDLFGSDLPVEGGRAGEFAWRDGEFLQALQQGHWVLLDEMNLAPQAVLEGLNAVLDHRGSVFIPELGRSFICHSSFRIFAAQNPLNQGGGRKGLPKSFINRFTKVYIEELTSDDYLLVCRHLFPDIEDEVLQAMIAFNSGLNQEVVIKKSFARDGFPWEFNLRDIIRWGTLISGQKHRQPSAYIDTVYLQRFRTLKDRAEARTISQSAFSGTGTLTSIPTLVLTSSALDLGHLSLLRNNFASSRRCGRLLKKNLTTLESLGDCISQSWLAIIVGSRNSGKTELVHSMANLAGNDVHEISVNPATDTMDILGSFEQVDFLAQVMEMIDKASSLFHANFRTLNGSRMSSVAWDLYNRLQSIRNISGAGDVRTPLRQIGWLVSELEASQVVANQDLSYLQSRVAALLATDNSTGRFEWIDGPLVQALKGGHWVLLDDANLCNPSVLDRLNSLCENDGQLVLSERGFVDGRVEIIKPHKNFRLFMTVNPQYGELSRAMRNRGIEITLVDNSNEGDSAIFQDYLRLPVLPSFSQSNSQGIVTQFDAVRRGHRVWQDTSCTNPLAALGILQCPSRCPGLLDQMASFSYAAPFPPEVIVPFIFRSSVPNLTSLIRRHDAYTQRSLSSAVTSWGQILDLFSTTEFQAGLHVFHNMTNNHDETSLKSQVAKPLDFYMISNRSGHENEEISVHHLALLNYLDLISSNFLSDANDATLVPTSQLSDKAAAIAREVKAVVTSVNNAAATISQGFLSNPYTSSPDARKIPALKLYAMHLRRIAHVTPFDFSKAHAIMKWFTNLLENASPTFSGVAIAINSLRDMMSLTSGFALTEVWDSFYIHIPDQLASDLHKFSHLSQHLKDESALEAVRRQILDTLSVGFLQPDVVLSGKYIELRSKLDLYLSSSVDPIASQAVPIPHSFDSAELALELSILSEVNLKKATNNMQRLIHLACGDKDVPLSHLVPYQRLNWAVQHESGELNKGDIKASVLATVNWLEATWRLKKSDAISATSGPGFLREPTYLLGVLNACATEDIPLSQLDTYSKRVALQMQRMYLECDDRRTRSEMLEAFFFKNLGLITSCFGDSFGEDPAVFDRSRSANNVLERTVRKLSESSNPHFRGSIVQFVKPLCYVDEPHSSGLSWIALSRMLLTLSVPNIPLDPASIQNSNHNRLSEEQACLDGQISLHRNFEILQTGDNTNELIRHLVTQLCSIQDELSCAPHLPERGDISRLHQFWNEVGQFVDMVLNPCRVEALIGKLRSGDNNRMLEEEVLQESLSTFYQRLDTLYQDFSDLVLIIKLAIQYFRFGLRLLVSSSSAERTSPNSQDQYMSAVVAYPSVSSATNIIGKIGTFDYLGSNAFRGVLLGASAIVTQAGPGVEAMNWISNLDGLYQQARGLWAIDQAKERDADAAASTLYRKSNLDYSAMTDRELEAHEFLTLFPNYENILDEAPAPPPGKVVFSSFASEDQVSMLCDLHLTLLLPGHSEWPADSIFNDLRRETIGSLLDHSETHTTDALDLHSLPFRFSLLHEKHGSIVNPSANLGNLKRRPDFYLDSNIPEVGKVIPLLLRILSQLEALRLEWPDQEVLRDLADLCKKILDINCHSPVAKVLSAIEQLLLRTEDWEMYANRENTLRVHRDALVSQIVEWRRLELSSWQALLEAETNQCRRTGSKWWFHLYDATIRGVLSAVAEEEDSQNGSITAYLSDLVSLLGDFITSSSLGEFVHRLELLQSFATYSSHLMTVKCGREQEALGRVHTILSSTHRYFNQFSERLSARLMTERAALEQEIKQFIKLASWKDINVLALKASAQRSHHQLYKIVRKFREVLRKPISDQLLPEFISSSHPIPKHPSPSSHSTNLNDLQLPPPENLPSKIDHFARLQQTFTKFESIVHEKIRPMIFNIPFHRAEELAAEIITSCQRLSSIAVPSSLEDKDKRAKFLKSIQLQKRKAWSDLLKEMKSTGFSHRVKPEILTENTSPLWIKEQPLLPHGERRDMVDKIEEYFCKLQGCLPALRASAAAHHDEISTRDLSKGMALVENIFNISVVLRASLAHSSVAAADMSSALRRLKGLDLRGLAFYNRDLPEYLSLSHTFFHQSSKLLSELVSSIRTFHIKTAGSTIHATICEIERCLIDNNNLREHARQMLRFIRLPGFLALNEDERQILQTYPTVILSLQQDLQRWANQHPQLSHLLSPSYRWVVTESRGLSTPPAPSLGSSAITTNEILQPLINTLLATVQSAVSLCDKSTKQYATLDEDDHYLTRLVESIRRSNQVLNLEVLHTQLKTSLVNIRSAEIAKECIPRILPFLEVYLRLAQDQIIIQSQSVKSLFKLDHILCSVIQTVATKGFCKPPEESGDGGGDEAVQNTSEGVGLGEGSGQENVSKEIEDESQVEGLQGEDQDDKPQGRGKDEKEDALEMTEDFGGALEDVPENGDSDSDSGSEEGSDADPEERMEELDPSDPNAVDEKLWGDEDPRPEDKDGADKSNRDNAKTEDEKSEVVAKEGKDRESGKEKDNEPSTPEDATNQDESAEAEKQQDELEIEDDAGPNENGAPMDERLTEGDVLDLPEDMDIGNEEARDDIEMGDLDDIEDEQMPQPEDVQDNEGQEGEDQLDGKDNSPEDDSKALGDEEQPDITAEAGNDENPEEEGLPENDITGKADVSSGDGAVEEHRSVGNADQSAASGQTGASSRGGERGIESEKAANDLGPTSNQESKVDTGEQAESEMKGDEGSDGQEGGNPADTEFKQIPNPLRSLGDALKEIQQRFEEIMHPDDVDAHEASRGDVDPKAHQLEYLRPEDEDVDMQALGPAEQHDAAKLNDLKLVDGEEENGIDTPMNLDGDLTEGAPEQSEFEPPSSDQLKSRSQRADLEGAILQQVPKQTGLSTLLPEESAPKTETEQSELDQAVEAELRNWQVADYTSDGAERLWRLYESLTHDLAYALCEQLRLILEPTLATRLKGDYRTGKRLNMKKVISYIASDYTKDKIWLRRTKPSQREYQVLIAIDDSRSMAESHSIHLAYETLALLGKALNRLESGDISIVKFGEAVDVVHGFDDGPLTDQAGAKVIDAFRFNQKATNVLALLETSLSVLDSARERRSAGSSSASNLWQLEIIISDGMCQDHEKLRTVLRRAAEKRIMVVFIILDSLHTSPKAGGNASKDVTGRSILQMDKAEFKNVDGRMELQLQKYLDSFPFEYYVVLRDVEALPDVLASTLKQFFERISEQ